MIKVAVAGYGMAGRDFHCYLLRKAPGIELCGVWSRSREKREKAEREQGGRTWETYEDLVEDAEVDLVVIATPHHTHAPMAVRAMDAGKHVVTDKAMCMDADEASKMIEASRRNGVMLSVFHNRRWDWDYLTVRKVIEDGRLGAPYLFETAIMGYGEPGGWRAQADKSGGILYDWPPHLIDQALQLVPAPVRSVWCWITDRKWSVDIGSYAKLLMEFENDVLYQVEMSNLARAGKPRWYVLGEEGALVKHGRDPQEGAMRSGEIEEAEEPPEHHARLITGDGEEVLEPVRGSWKSYYRNISGHLNEGEELAVKAEEVREEVREVMRVLDAAMESARSGEAVRLS